MRKCDSPAKFGIFRRPGFLQSLLLFFTDPLFSPTTFLGTPLLIFTIFCKNMVCEVMYEHLIRLNALPNNKVLSDCSLEELKIQCDRGVQEIVAGHNDWLKKEWEKQHPATRSPFKPFKARKLSSISYTTLHKYLHRGRVSDEGSDKSSNDA